MKKGIFHFHSNYSYDGLISIERILKEIEILNLDFIILTDHNSIEGALELRKRCKIRFTNVEVLIAAEYYTSVGDIIVVGIEKPIQDMRYEHFLKEVKENNGLLILPHPYDGHKNIELVAADMDAIEVFNGRSTKSNNLKSLELAKNFRKPFIWSSDAHIPHSLNNVVIGYPDDSMCFSEALMASKLSPIHFNYSSPLDMLFSQIKKHWTNRNYYLLAISILRGVKRLLFNRGS